MDIVRNILKEHIIPIYPKALNWYDKIEYQPDYVVNLVKEKQTIVGLMIIRTTDKRLYTFVILPEFRNKGYGSKAISKYKNMILYTKSRVKSLKYFYDRCGVAFISDNRKD